MSCLQDILPLVVAAAVGGGERVAVLYQGRLSSWERMSKAEGRRIVAQKDPPWEPANRYWLGLKKQGVGTRLNVNR